MVQWLNTLKANTNSSDDPLKIVQIINDDQSGNVEFEVPMSYDLLAAHEILEKDGMEKNGKFDLIINSRAFSTGCWRATNGNCILGCDANDFTPGTNQVQVEFFIFNPSNMDRILMATGPIAEFVSSNVCRANEHVTFDYSKGEAVLWADLSIQNASFSIELLDTNANHIKTISGITTNGVINERWNLIGDSGKIYPHDSFNAVYHIALVNSLLQTKNQTNNTQSP